MAFQTGDLLFIQRGASTFYSVSGNDFFEISNSIEAGTSMLFVQAAAPTGFTRVETHNTRLIRIVSGAGGGLSGTIPYTTFQSTNYPYQMNVTGSFNVAVNPTTLTEGQLPSHSHPAGGGAGLRWAYKQSGGSTGMGNSPTANVTASSGGSVGHSHTLTSSGTTIDNNTTSNFNIQYCTTIECVKA